MITDKDIEKLKAEFKTVFATKEDLNRFATKDDLKRFATKEDLKQFATKKDLDDRLKNHPTRTEMQQMGVDIISTMEKIFNDLSEKMEKRFDDIDKKLVEITTWKPIILNHEERIQIVEKKVSSLN